MDGLTPMSELRSHQQGPFTEMLALLDQMEHDPDKFDAERASALTTLMEVACANADDLFAMNDELQEWVRWRRAPAFFLTWAFQDVTSKRQSPAHIDASLRYSDALIGIGSDDSVLPLEIAWRTLTSVLENVHEIASSKAELDAMSSQLDHWRTLILGRLQVHHSFYSTWSDPATHQEMNPVVEHLYRKRTWGSLVTAFPEVGTTAQGLALVPVLERAVATSEVTGNAYHWLIARHYLAAQLCDVGRAKEGTAQLRATIEDAIELNLEAEVGQLLRVLALQHAASGDAHGALETLERALDFERPPTLFWYWYGLTLREWADVRIALAMSGGTFPEIDEALKAYRSGRILMDERLGNTGTPVARAVKRQAWAFSTERAVTFALIRGYVPEALAETEASGPQDIVHTLAEMRATQDLPRVDMDEYREARAVFHRHLTTVPAAFNEYVASMEDEYELRRRYLVARGSLKTGILSLTSDQVVARLLEHGDEDRVVVVLFVAENGKSSAILVDLKDHSALSEAFPMTGPDIRGAVQIYVDEISRAAELPDPGPVTRSALDRLLETVAGQFGPILEVLNERARGRPLTIVPRSQLNLLPLHALQRGASEALLDIAAEVTVVPSLAVLVDLLRRLDSEPGTCEILAVHDPAGAPLLDGAFACAETDSPLRVMIGAGPQHVVETLNHVADVDLVLACHGEFDPERPSASVLYLGEGSVLAVADLTRGVSVSRCRSVALVACESGMVRAGIGSEYLGLPGVLLSAGVRTAIGSLWEVNQLASSILLSYYLDGLTHGRSVAGALRDAQQRLRALPRVEAQMWVQRRLKTQAQMILPLLASMPDLPFEHPDYWAGFYAAGV